MNITKVSKKGFTLIELIVVMAILAILVLLANASYRGYSQRAELTRIKNDARVASNLVDEHLVHGKALTGDTISVEDLQNFMEDGRVFNNTGSIDAIEPGTYFKLDDSFKGNSKLPGDFYANDRGFTVYVHDKGMGDSDGTSEPVIVYSDKDYFFFNAGTGAITGFRLGPPNLPELRDPVIPPTIGGVAVTSIADGAFAEKQLTSVVIPNSVISIGYNAFRGNNLTRVTIGNGVTSIMGGAFRDNKLTSVAIPDSVTSVEGLAFRGNNLTSVTIGNGVTNIGINAFSYNNLTSVVIPNSVISIGANAFQNNNITSLTIGNGVTNIDSFAFESNNLTSVTIPNSVTNIGLNAFSYNNLTSVTFLGSPSDLGFNVFVRNGASQSSFNLSFQGIGTYTLSGNTWMKQ